MDAATRKQVFIGGCQRSGTTLLGSILGRHPDAVCTPESQFKIRLLRSLHCRGPYDAAKAWASVASDWRLRLWGISPAALGEHRLLRARSDGELLNRIAAHYAGSIGRPSVSCWIDHTPNNLSHVATLAGTFAESKFIHIVRDGRAVAASIVPLDWGPNTVLHAAPWWVARVAYGLGAESLLADDRVLRVRYEKLVMRPEDAVREICAFVGLDFEDSLLVESSAPLPPYTVNQHELVGGQLVPSRVDAWRERLSARETEIFEHWSFDMLSCLGYAPEFGVKARGASKLERGLYEMRELGFCGWNRLVRRPIRRRRGRRTSAGPRA